MPHRGIIRVGGRGVTESDVNGQILDPFEIPKAFQRMGDAGINSVFSAPSDTSTGSQTKRQHLVKVLSWERRLTALMRHIRSPKGEGSYVSRQSQAGCGLPSAHTSTGSARAAPHPLTMDSGLGNDGYTKGTPRRTPKGHLQHVRDAGMNLVAPPLDSCSAGMSGPTSARVMALQSALGIGNGGGMGGRSGGAGFGAPV